MELEEKHKQIIEKLNAGMKFGMFEKGMKCYFQDGTHVSYGDLWKAVRHMNNLENAGNKTLAQLCPGTYVGAHTHKHSKHNWKKNATAATA